MKKFLLSVAFIAINSIMALAIGPSGTLPVIYINIDNNEEVTSKENYLNGQYWLDPKNTSDISAIGSSDSPLPLKIKGRGNYTFTGFEKKPYRLKLDKKQPLLGLESSKHFGLLAHADDSRGFIRNTLGFEISKNLGLPWTPEQRPVELVVNGTYRGLYFLVELIRIDKKRVNISEWGEEDSSGNPLSKWIEGGTLVEIDNYDEDGQIQLTDGDGEIMRITYDKSVDPGYEPDGYREWLENQFATMNSLIFGDKNSNEIWKYIDLDDCARFVLTQDITNNYESFHGSCYLFREKGENEKWHFSPVWDFGSAFFNDSHPRKHFWVDSFHHNHWIAQLWEFPALREKMAELWHEYRKTSFDDLTCFTQNFISEIKDAAAYDKERWPQYGNDNLNEKFNYAKNFLNGAKSFLDAEFPVQNVDEPEDFVVPEDEYGVYNVFFRQTGKASDWSNVKIYYWDNHFKTIDWPGEDCKKVEINGSSYWYYRMGANEESDDYMLIFNNGQSGVGDNQTADLKVRKRGVYTLDMPDHAIPEEFLEVGSGTSVINTIADYSNSGNIISVNTFGNYLKIEAHTSGSIDIYQIDGTGLRFELTGGENIIELPKGIYIIEGKKYLL